MKLSTFQTRTKNISKNSNAYRYAYSLLTGTIKVYTCYTLGNGRNIKNYDCTIDTIKVLSSLKLKLNKDYCLLNDAPRGGKTGQFLILTKIGKTKLITL